MHVRAEEQICKVARPSANATGHLKRARVHTRNWSTAVARSVNARRPPHIEQDIMALPTLRCHEVKHWLALLLCGEAGKLCNASCINLDDQVTNEASMSCVKAPMVHVHDKQASIHIYIYICNPYPAIVMDQSVAPARPTTPVHPPPRWICL